MAKETEFSFLLLLLPTIMCAMTYSEIKDLKSQIRTLQFKQELTKRSADLERAQLEPETVLMKQALSLYKTLKSKYEKAAAQLELDEDSYAMDVALYQQENIWQETIGDDELEYSRQRCEKLRLKTDEAKRSLDAFCSTLNERYASLHSLLISTHEDELEIYTLQLKLERELSGEESNEKIQELMSDINDITQYLQEVNAMQVPVYPVA